MNRWPKRYKSLQIEKNINARRHQRALRARPKSTGKKSSASNTLRITMPERIGLEEGKGRAETLRAVHKILEPTHRSGCVLDFSKTIYPESLGMIYLLAVIDLIQSIRPNLNIRAIEVRSERVLQVLQQIGLAEKLGLQRKIPITRDDVRFWRYVTGASVDASLVGDAFEDLCAATQISDSSRNALYNAMTEAIDNAYSHAYAENLTHHSPRIFPPDKRWWMFFGVIEQRVVIVACDLGLGIPATIQRKGWLEAIRANIQNDDGSLIHAAIEHARSRTLEAHRGKGMAKLRQAAEESGGSLIVCSSRGWYAFGSDKPDYHRSYRDTVHGTIIGWMIPIQTRSP